MAVVTRKNAKGQKVYWVAFYDADRKQRWERVGADKRAAEALDRRRQKEVEDGTYELAARPTMPFGQWLRSWVEKRTNRNADDDKRLVANHLLSIEWLRLIPCEDLRPKHSDQLVEELKAKVSAETGKPLSEKYVSNLYGLFRTAVQDARRAELIAIDPCVLKRGLLRRKSKHGVRVPYEPADVLALLNVEDPETAAFVTLAFLTGCREGEICGLRWRAWDRHSVPMGCLNVLTQYDDRPLKTERGTGGEHARKVPVHPELERMLTWWWEEGFEFVYCRRPTPDDFIVPRTKDGKNHTKSSGYKLWVRACAAAGVDNRSLHSTRHTFVTLCRRGGARGEVVERITHNASGAMVDHYTHFDWAPLCEAVSFLALPKASPPGGGTPAIGSGNTEDGRVPLLDLNLDRLAESSGKQALSGWRRRESKSGPGTAESGNARRNEEDQAPQEPTISRRLPRSAARDCPSQETPTPSDTARSVPGATSQDAEIRRASTRLRRHGDRPAKLLFRGVELAYEGDEAGTLEVLREVAGMVSGGGR